MPDLLALARLRDRGPRRQSRGSRALDGGLPAAAEVSAKRWANMRSDLTAAIAASGLRPMLQTTGVDLDEAWRNLLVAADRRIRVQGSRFTHWASLRQICPDAVDGIYPVTIGQIFEPFFTTKPKGMGMGLAIARSIIKAHGGQISARRNPDRGSTFEIVLPALREDI